MNKNLFIFPSLFLIVQPVFEFYDAVENEKVRNDFGPEARSAAASSRYVFFFLPRITRIFTSKFCDCLCLFAVYQLSLNLKNQRADDLF
jgi:hypothetical protein